MTISVILNEIMIYLFLQKIVENLKLFRNIKRLQYLHLDYYINFSIFNLDGAAHSVGVLQLQSHNTIELLLLSVWHFTWSRCVCLGFLLVYQFLYISTKNDAKLTITLTLV